jgi:hypothetical protein
MHTGLTSVHEPNGRPARILFLVHGTFAKRAHWVRSGSPFCESLLRHLEPDTSIQCFIWSGRNSIGARQEATHRLGELLRESVTRFRGVRHFVIGHSHGGNVALNAVASPDLADVGVVCLSAPILYAMPRTALTESNAFLWLIISFFNIVALVALVVLASHRLKWGDLVYWSMAVLVSFLGWKALAAYRDNAKLVAQTINVPYHVHDRVLFLRFVGDEASLALGAFQALQYVMNSLIRAIVAVFSVGFRFWKWAIADSNWNWVGISSVLLGMSMIVDSFSNFNMLWLDFPMLLVWGLLLLAPLLLTPTLALFALVTGFVSILVGIAPFGFRLAIATMWIELCVEALPCGRWNALVLEPSAQSSAAGLRHSFCYQEEPAIRAIVEHVKGNPKREEGAASKA